MGKIILKIENLCLLTFKYINPNDILDKLKRYNIELLKIQGKNTSIQSIKECLIRLFRSNSVQIKEENEQCLKITDIFLGISFSFILIIKNSNGKVVFCAFVKEMTLKNSLENKQGLFDYIKREILEQAFKELL